jgi:recombination protein RecT
MGNELARRVRENTDSAGTAVEKADREAGAPSMGQRIMQMQEQFRLAMPRGAEAAQLVRDALTCLRTTPKLAQCDPTSVLGALMTCAQLGLRPGVPGLGHAWPVPFWDSRFVWLDDKGRERTGAQRAQLIIGYQGYRELAQRSGQISTVIARVVHAHDLFEIDYGLADNLVHKPKLDGPRGDAVGYYAIVKYTSGGYAFWHMSKSEVEEHRDRFAMARKPIWRDGKKTSETEIVGPWRDDFDSMAAKTTFLRLAKWMPKSTELASAIEADGTVRVDLTPEPDTMLYGERPDVLDGEAVEPQGDTEPVTGAGAEADSAAATGTDNVAVEKPISTSVAKEILDKFAACGVTEKAALLATISTLVGRRMTVTKDLTRIEGDRLVGTLDACIADPDGPVQSLAAHLVDLQRDAQEARS